MAGLVSADKFQPSSSAAARLLLLRAYLLQAVVDKRLFNFCCCWHFSSSAATPLPCRGAAATVHEFVDVKMSTLCRAGPPQQHNSWSPLPCGGIPALPGIPPEVAPPNSVTPRHLNNLFFHRFLPQVTHSGDHVIAGPTSSMPPEVENFAELSSWAPSVPARPLNSLRDFQPRSDDDREFHDLPGAAVPKPTFSGLWSDLRRHDNDGHRFSSFANRVFFLFLLQNVQLSSVGPWYWKRRRLRRRWWCCTTVFTVHQPAVGLVQSGDGPAAAAASAETP